jgi:hypothetical protein
VSLYRSCPMWGVPELDMAAGSEGTNGSRRIEIKRAIVNMVHLKICVILLLCAPLLGGYISASDRPAAATDFDVVVPKSGHPLFGAFQGTTDDGISFMLDSGSTLSIPWEKIKELQLNHKVTLQVARRAAGESTATTEFDRALIKVDVHDLVIVSASGDMTIAWVDVASISNSSAAGVRDRTAWRGVIAPTASLITGTQGQQTLGGSLEIKRTAHPAREDWHQQSIALELDASSLLVTQAGSAPIRAHEYDGKLNNEVKLTQHLYANAFASGYHNNSFALYLEQTYGGGLGGRISGGKHSLEVSGDLLFIGEHFYRSSKSLGFAAADLTETFTIVLAHLKGGNLVFGETGAYVPAFNQQKAWQARGNADLSIPIFKNFAWNFEYRDDYMENAPNLRKTWSTSSTGITYTLSSPRR